MLKHYDVGYPRCGRRRPDTSAMCYTLTRGIGADAGQQVVPPRFSTNADPVYRTDTTFRCLVPFISATKP